jgi:adenosylcobinamide-GDP ribazoletransferase
MRSFLLALQLLTRIPVRVGGEVSGSQLARSAALFPAVGAIQGAIAAGGAWLFLEGFGPAVAGALVLALLAATNGGFHLDGLADTFDGFAVRSSGDPARDRARRLAVMKESATGAIGVVAVVFAVLVKALLLGSVLAAAAPAAALAVVALLPVLAKWSLLPALLAGAPARADGLGRSFIELCTPGTVAIGTLTAVALFVAGGAAAGLRAGELAAAAVLAFGALATFSLVFTRACRGAFGGITGDSLGAISELAEAMVLGGAALWLRHSS